MQTLTFEEKLRRLQDEGVKLLPKMSGAQVELAYQHHRFLADAAEAELQRRKAQ